MSRNMMDRCNKCYYWVQLNTQPGVGSCHRYPRYTDKYSNDFCGEFARREDLVAEKRDRESIVSSLRKLVSR